MEWSRLHWLCPVLSALPFKPGSQTREWGVDKQWDAVNNKGLSVGPATNAVQEEEGAPAPRGISGPRAAASPENKDRARKAAARGTRESEITRSRNLSHFLALTNPAENTDCRHS